MYLSFKYLLSKNFTLHKIYYGHLIQSTQIYLDEKSGSNFSICFIRLHIVSPSITFYSVMANTTEK